MVPTRNCGWYVWHQDVARIVHTQLALHSGLLGELVPNYRYRTSPVLENDRSKLYLYRTILIDRRVIVVDVTIPINQNLEETHDRKIKFRPLAMEFTNLRGWRRVPKIVPNVLSGTGIILKTTGSAKCFENWEEIVLSITCANLKVSGQV